MSEHDAPLARETFDEWPAALGGMLDGTELQGKSGLALSLVVVDDQGRPHTSLLSIGEVLALDTRGVRLALWPRSRAAAALGKMGRAALTLVLDQAFYQIQFAVTAWSAERHTPLANDLALFSGTIESGEALSVGYARLTHGIGFALAGDIAADIIARWEEQVRALRAMPA